MTTDFAGGYMDEQQFSDRGLSYDYDYNLYILRTALAPYVAWAVDWWQRYGDEQLPSKGVHRVDGLTGAYVRVTGKKFPCVAKDLNGLSAYPLVAVSELGVTGIGGGLCKFVETAASDGDLNTDGMVIEAHWNAPQVLDRGHWLAIVPDSVSYSMRERHGYALSLRLSELQEIAAGTLPDSVCVKAVRLYSEVAKKVSKIERGKVWQ